MGDFTTFLNAVKLVAGVAGTGVGGTLVYRAGLRVYDDISKRAYLRQQQRLTLEHVATQNRLRDIREIRADERGRYPLLYGESGILRDPNNLRAFTLHAVRETWPGLERLDAVIRAVLGAGGWPTSATAQQMLPDTSLVAAGAAWRAVTLQELIGAYGRPSYHRLMLGETVDQATGERKLVSGDMSDFVHIILTGSTGWGKSTALEAMAKQLVIAGDCDLAFVDYGVNTFGMLAKHGLYPIADTPATAVVLFRVLVQEMHVRRSAMARYPQVKRLDQYNEIADADLRPVVVFCDEASSLLDRSSEARDLVRDLTSMGRKYGLGCVFGGTDFKVDTMPSETRGNCGLRMAMHLEEPQLSRSIIRSTKAVNLMDKGRALAILPGVAGLVEIQCPQVGQWVDLPSKRAQVDLSSATETATAGGDLDQVTLGALDIDQVHAMLDDGETASAIARAAFGYSNGDKVRFVQSFIAEHDDDDGGHDDKMVESDDKGIDPVVVVVDLCDFCGRSAEMAGGATFGICPACGVEICSDCTTGTGLCSDCEGENG